MFESNLNRILFWCGIPLGILAILFAVLRPFQTLELLPAETPKYSVHTYLDSIEKSGKPTRLFGTKASGSQISFSYALGDKELYPYAGVSLHSPKDSYFDISSFDYVNLEVKATKGKRLQLHISTFATGFTKPNDLLSYRYFLKELDLDNAQNKYSVSLKDFTTPTWWYNEKGISEKDLKEPEFDKMRVFNVQNCQLIGRNIDDTITIEKISFSKSPVLFYSLVFSFLIGYYVSLYVVHLLKLKSDTGNKKIQINYNPVSGKNQFGKELEKVIDFISANYSDPELSLRKIQLGTGVSESKVSALIREKFDLSFKQFLNQLRLNEIKRLLTETELPIADIAYKVGYGNISHFNRVFKEMEGVSPNDYRKKVKA